MKTLLNVLFILLFINVFTLSGDDFAVSGNQVSVALDGYIQSCTKPAIYVFEDGQWRPARRELPAKGNYYLDGEFVGYGWCDVLVCNPVEQPVEIELIEYDKLGEKPAPETRETKEGIKYPVFKSVPLKGRLKIEIEYFRDCKCIDGIIYSKIFIIK